MTYILVLLSPPKNYSTFAKDNVEQVTKVSKHFCYSCMFVYDLKSTHLNDF